MYYTEGEKGKKAREIIYSENTRWFMNRKRGIPRSEEEGAWKFRFPGVEKFVFAISRLTS